jgi:hypothetical protein
MVYGQLVDGQCGIGGLKKFTETTPPYSVEHYESYGYSHLDSGKPLKHCGGIGMFGSGFVNSPSCKKVYEVLNQRFKLVFITPVRQNKNSGNQFFYAMWDDKENDDVTYITPPPWPFEDE